MREPAAPQGDEPGRIVGRRRAARRMSAANDSKASASAWRRAFPTPFVPRGVYRFTSHEEADRWFWEMITRPRRR
jgi:hypothetical protein